MTLEELFVFGDDGKARHAWTNGQGDSILTVWVEDRNIRIDNKSEVNDIEIPIAVISKLILDADITIIRSQLKEYVEKD